MRSRDRLQELAQVASAAGGVYEDTVVEVSSQHDKDKDIDDMFREVDAMRSWIYELENNTQRIRRLHTDTTYHTNKQLQEQLDSVVTASNALGLKVCGALREFERRARLGGNSVLERMARLQYAATRRLYADALTAHHALLAAIRDDHHHLLQQQIKLTNLTISDEECQSLLDSKNLSLFVDNLEAETAQARSELRDVEARRDELARVEASLVAVRDLFTQLAHLVASQQEQIDSVEYYALQATEHVEYGGQELLKGTVSRNKTRKKKVGLIICLASGFLIVLFVLIFT